jgi:GT2 family glycosyltransferase
MSTHKGQTTVNRSIQQLSLCDDKVIPADPVAPENPKRIALVFHVFYTDIWPELCGYLQQLDCDYDLFVTVTDRCSDAEAAEMLQAFAKMHLYRVENRGRDIKPFVEVLDIIGTKTYRYLCKLHTKKTGESALGNVWRKLLYFDMLGSRETVQSILDLFESQPDVGIVTGKSAILDSSRYDYDNAPRVKTLARQSGTPFKEEYDFPGGTMFWIRTELLDPLVRLYREGHLHFEEELGQIDHTLAHAIERFFGVIAQSQGQTLAKSPSRYSQFDDETLDELAALLLSQQYFNFNTYVLLKQEIQKRDEMIAHLHDQSPKSRIKRLLPKPVLKLIRQIKLLKQNPQPLHKAWFYLKRGDVGFLLSKSIQKIRQNLHQNAKLEALTLDGYFQRFDFELFATLNQRIDIIIPVYDGYEFLDRLFDSLEKNTHSTHRLIVINDGSPDARVKPLLLQRLKQHPDALFIDHENNLGFVRSVLDAYAHINGHFVILNTDTEVPAFWLERLMYPIFHMEKVASTTPFTNSGEIASFPNFVSDNEILEGMDVDTLDRNFRQVNADIFYEEIPTGVGFCMGINYALTREIGFFREDLFGKGYGEENDWCQRAIAEGYRNLLVPNLFVYHKHGGSFSAEEKQKLLEQNIAKLVGLHPTYEKQVMSYIQRDPHKHLRDMMMLIALSQHDRGVSLLIDHALGGGANHYAQEVIARYREEERKLLTLSYDFYSHLFVLDFTYRAHHFAYTLERLEDLELLFGKIKIEEIFLNSLVSFPQAHRLIGLIEKVVHTDGARLTIPLHDYYPLCPNYTLLDETGRYCQVPSLQRCQQCMAHNEQEWKSFFEGNPSVEAWRSEWGALLDLATTILAFSQTSRAILLTAYPHLDSKITVTPHKTAPLPAVKHPKKQTGRKVIGILGALNHAKGAGILKALVARIDARDLPIDVVLIGETSGRVKSKHFKMTGRYTREELPRLVADYGIDLFLIPSIWPETFSYTTQEIMMMQMPLMVFDLGAPAERVRTYEQGLILEDFEPDTIIGHTLERA